MITPSGCSMTHGGEGPAVFDGAEIRQYARTPLQRRRMQVRRLREFDDLSFQPAACGLVSLRSDKRVGCRIADGRL
jgi:hypothetical protein